MAEKSKILIIGGTGYIGKFIVEASATAGHPTFALGRESSMSDPVKSKLVEKFRNLGVTILYGDLNDHESLVKAIKQVDVVISTVGGHQLLDQTKIVAAIKEVGTVKRFLPSEFGSNVYHKNEAVEPAKKEFEDQAQIRRVVEAEGLPYTYIVSNCFAGYNLPTLCQLQPGLTSPPRDRVLIYGDGNAKAVINKEEDIAVYTIKTVDDPRMLNKSLYIKPAENIVSMNELVAIWEKKIGKTLEKTFFSEEQILKCIQESEFPLNMMWAINHSVYVKGDLLGYTIEPSSGVEAAELYPDVKYTTIEEYLGQFV